MADVCDGYSYLLAAEDAIPIVLGGIGFFCLAARFRRSIPEVGPAVYFAATILVIGSALAGPIRKAFIAGGAGCDSLDWMQVVFFAALPIGFSILAWASSCVLRGRKATFLPFGIAVAAIFLGASLAERALILLATAGLFAVANGFECAVIAKRDRAGLAAVLFVLYALGTLALPALGSNDNRSAVANQWLEQGTNTVTQTVFVIAAYLLLRASTRAGERPVLVEN